MKKLSPVFLTVSLALPLLTAGCINAESTFTRENDTRATKCYAVAFGVISSIIAETVYQRCKKQMTEAGYQEVRR